MYNSIYEIVCIQFIFSQYYYCGKLIITLVDAVPIEKKIILSYCLIVKE